MTCADALLNREQRRMLRFGSFGVDTPKCRILFRFTGTDGGVQLFSRTSTTRSSQMPPRPLWAFLWSLSGIEIVPYYLVSDLFLACRTLIIDALILGMAVDALDSRRPTGLVRHNCSSAYVLDHLGVRTIHSYVH